MLNKYKYSLGALAVASLSCIFLVFARFSYSERQTYIFLNWNLFLAWVPLILAMLTQFVFYRKRRLTLVVAILAFAWIVFYPNAPYILTDFIHIKARDGVPLWFDLILLLSFSWAGLFAGFMSLFLMQEVADYIWGRLAGWIFVLAALALGSLGIYAGRFLRWNSWDLIVDPLMLLRDVKAVGADPFIYPRTIGFTALFFLFLVFAYAFLYSFGNLQRGERVRRK